MRTIKTIQWRKLKMGYYVTNAGEEKNPLNPQERVAARRLAEGIPSMYVNGPMHPDFRQRLDKIGTNGVLSLIKNLHDVSRFDNVESKSMRVIEENGGIEYLIQQLKSNI